MNFKLELTGLKEYQAGLSDMAKTKIPVAVMNAMNATVYGARTAVQAEMEKTFKPKTTPFVLRGVLYEKATPDNLSCSVYIKGENDPLFTVEEPGQVMRPHIFGGPRFLKKSEKRLRSWAGRELLGPDQFIAPGPGAPLDAYGNISGPQMQRILGSIKAYQEPGYNVTKKTNNYFAIPRAGIFKRVGKVNIPIIFFIKAPIYRKRFAFFETAKKHFIDNFLKNLIQAWGTTMLKAGARGR